MAESGKQLLLWESRMQFLEEFQKESETQSDRGVVLVCVSILDELLAELLKTRLLRDEKLLKDVFGTKGVFGQFDDKVKACYSIGLISELDYKLFAKLQNVRNKFAHRVLGISFEDPSIRDVCMNISLPKNAFMPWDIFSDDEEKKNLDLNPIKKDTPARERFLLAFIFLFSELENRQFVNYQNEIEPPADFMTFSIMLENLEGKWEQVEMEREKDLLSFKKTLEMHIEYLEATEIMIKSEKDKSIKRELEEEFLRLQENKLQLEGIIQETEKETVEKIEGQNLMRAILNYLGKKVEQAKE